MTNPLTLQQKYGFVAGKTYEVHYPFVCEKVTLFDEDGPYEAESWRPGVELGGPDMSIADAIGVMILHVVDIHELPGHYPPRVFFTRRWRDPNEKEFGKKGLHIMTVQAFKRRLSGYMHEYEIVTKRDAEQCRYD